jgi:hypothetical protein
MYTFEEEGARRIVAAVRTVEGTPDVTRRRPKRMRVNSPALICVLTEELAHGNFLAPASAKATVYALERDQPLVGEETLTVSDKETEVTVYDLGFVGQNPVDTPLLCLRLGGLLVAFSAGPTIVGCVLQGTLTAGGFVDAQIRNMANDAPADEVAINGEDTTIVVHDRLLALGESVASGSEVWAMRVDGTWYLLATQCSNVS